MVSRSLFGWRAVLFCLAWLSGLVIGCASKGPQYPEEHARYRRIDEAVEAVRKAYVKKNLSDIEAMMLPGETLDRLQQEIQKDFQRFEDISLDFSIERIVIEGDTIDVFLHWQGLWKRNPAETGVRERGHGMLRWVGVQSILLSGVAGDLPFGMASRHTLISPSAETVR